LQLSSEPPLPYSDIVSLLATGVTKSELSGNADILASKAALLAVQELYRRIFKKGQGPPPENKSAVGNFLDRFTVDLGPVNNHTGGQDIIAKYKLTDHWDLVGDLATEEGFTGRLKYLIRFR
jgi:hypothetical protein